MAYKHDYNVQYSIKYNKEKFKRVALDVKKEYYTDILKPAANARHMSVRGFILAAINEKIEREK